MSFASRADEAGLLFRKRHAKFSKVHATSLHAVVNLSARSAMIEPSLRERLLDRVVDDPIVSLADDLEHSLIGA